MQNILGISSHQPVKGQTVVLVPDLMGAIEFKRGNSLQNKTDAGPHLQ